MIDAVVEPRTVGGGEGIREALVEDEGQGAGSELGRESQGVYAGVLWSGEGWAMD